MDRTKNTGEIGRTYYTKDGRMIELLAHTIDGRFVAAEILDADDYDGGTRAVWGKTVIEDAIFTKPPRQKVDDELVALRAEARKLEEMNNAARIRVIDAERDVRQRLDKLKKYSGLELLDDFIDGKISHVIILNDFSIKTFSEAFTEKDNYGRPEGMKLLSLYGKSNGDLTWRRGFYSDGSGGIGTEIIPCLSEVDAVEKRRIAVETMLDDRFAMAKREDRYIPYFVDGVRTALKYKVAVSREILDLFNQRDAITRAANRATFEKQIAEAKAKLAALDDGNV